MEVPPLMKKVGWGVWEALVAMTLALEQGAGRERQLKQCQRVTGRLMVGMVPVMLRFMAIERSTLSWAGVPVERRRPVVQEQVAALYG